uniref:Tripartite tricarboxylate transporter permease n=1 Tax=Bosea sp. NBC_00436 TaxID=2969620 RepID=A0A9E8CRK7_9HYPH
MEVISHLALGFGHALTLENLLFCAIGCVLGTIVGLLPGLGPLAAISILLPLTYTMPLMGSLIMMAGIYYGAMYGEAVSAITMRIPHSSSIVMCIDGYSLSQKGKTGLALFTAGLSNFIGGTIAILILAWLAPQLGEVALKFGPADFCALMLMGFVCVSFFTTGSLINGFTMCLIGVLLGQVGGDINSGVMRFTFDMHFLAEGISIVSIALGCFGIAEITHNLDKKNQQTPFSGNIKLIPTWPELKRIFPSAIRGGLVGSFLGILPGGGPVLAQFGSYAVDKKVSKYRNEIGEGAIEGVAAPAAADEAAARTAFIPLMSLGIPETATTALMMAAFIIKGVRPGPNLITDHPDLFWGLVASMWIGNCLLLILNVPLVRIWLTLFKIPYSVLYPAMLFFCSIGTYSVNQNLNDIYVTGLFGALGYLFFRLGLDAAPLMLGFIIGPMLEENFRRALLMSEGHFGIFFESPISATLLGLIALFIGWQLVSFVLGRMRVRSGAVPGASA